MVSVTDPYGHILGFLDRTYCVNPIDNTHYASITTTKSTHTKYSHKGLYLHKHTTTKIEWTHTDIHSSTGILIHDSGIRAVKRVHALNCAATVISFACFNLYRRPSGPETWERISSWLAHSQLFTCQHTVPHHIYLQESPLQIKLITMFQSEIQFVRFHLCY
jgi:hypothetical protein